MEAGLMDANQSLANAYMPKNPMDAYNVGTGMSEAPGPGVVRPGQQFNANVDTGLMNRGMPQMAGRMGNQSKFGKFATKQGMQMMMPKQQQPMPQQRPFQHQESQSALPYSSPYDQQEIPEELKRLL